MNGYALAMATLMCSLVLPVGAAEYALGPLDEPAPADEFSPEVLQQIGSKGVTITKGKRTLVEIWPAKTWNIRADFKPTSEVAYPFEPGQLVGVARFKSKGSDFRGQEIKPGSYTLRYGQQPVDGNHVGTAPSRDFFLLLPAAEDQSPQVLAKETLFKQSADAAETSHPAILYLQPGASAADEPAIEHNEEHDWWIASFANPARADGTASELAVRLVVVGQGQE